MYDFIHDAFSPVLPIQRPRWTVSIQLFGGILIAKHIVTHDRKNSCKNKGYEDFQFNLFRPKS